jgi:branched-chain amino acid transport system permease protein
MTAFAKTAGVLTRSYAEELRLARTLRQRVGVLALVALVATFPLWATGEYVDITNQALIAAIGAIGLNILTGYAGLLSLGQAALLGIAGFSSAIMAGQWHLPFVLVVVCSMTIGGLVGALVGLPAVRLRGLYLVISTFAFHYVAILGLTEYQSYRNATAAFSGLTLPTPGVGSLKLSTIHQWYWFLIVVVGVAVIFALNLRRTRPGRARIAVRDHDLVSSALGINVPLYKLRAFVVSSALTSLAGTLLAYYNTAVTVETYSIELAVAYIVMIIVGGLGSTGGALLGALVITIFPNVETSLFQLFGASSYAQINYILPLQLTIYGALIAIFLIFIPEGIAGLIERVVTYLRLWPARYELSLDRSD